MFRCGLAEENDGVVEYEEEVAEEIVRAVLVDPSVEPGLDHVEVHVLPNQVLVPL